MDDAEQLERELSWEDPQPHRDRRWLKTRPSGVNVIYAFAGIFWLSGMGATLELLGPFSVERGLGSLIGFLMGMAVWLAVSIWLARRLWVAIGSGPRSALRPLGVLGPLPTALILVIGFGVVIGVAERVAKGESLDQILTGGPLEGEDWRVAYGTRGGRVLPLRMSLADAEAHCAKQGPGWRLPRKTDAPVLNAQLRAYALRRVSFHVPTSEPGRYEFIQYEERDKGFITGYSSAPMAHCALCLRDGGG